MKIRSKKHREFVASEPCMITGYTHGVQAHHLLRVEGKGMGTKSCDRWCVPLHYTIHDALHKNGNEVVFFANHGWHYEDVKGIALALAQGSPDKKIRDVSCETTE